jgi:hypothetical protein
MSDTNPLPNDPETSVTNRPAAPSETELPSDVVQVGAGIDFTDPNSPLAPFYMRVTDVVAAAFLAIVFSLMTQAVPIHHTDVWAHLRFGEEIVQGRWPQHEPFPESYADKEAPYIHYQWLVQAGGYLIYMAGHKLAAADSDHQLAGGALLLTSVQALIVVLRLLLLYLAFKRLTNSPPIALVGIVLVTAMSSVVHLGIIRPQIVGELAFAAVLLALSRPVLSKRALIAVPLVFLVWANCHGSFPIGFVLLGTVFAGRVLQVLWDCRRGGVRAALTAAWSDTGARRLALLLLLSVAATNINPHGPRLLIEGFKLSQNKNIADMEEWKSLPYAASPHYVVFASVLLLAWLLRASPRPLGVTAVLLLLGFGLQSVLHARYVVWWTMVFPWVIVPHLHAALERRRVSWLDDPSVPSFRKTALAVLMVLSLLCWSPLSWWLLYHQAPELKQRVVPQTPVEVARTLNSLDHDKKRVVFASESEGDYLLWAIRNADMKISCYTHVHLFTREHWEKCVIVKQAAPGWRDVLEKDFDADYLVLEYNEYEQEEHLKNGQRPGTFNLIDHVKKLPSVWHVIEEKPVFFAERIRPAP